MHNKKKSESKKTPEQEALEKHVDAMMDPKQPDEAPAKSAPAPSLEKAEPKITAVTIPAGDAPTTAPELSKPHKITISDETTQPLLIDKIDELTKSITEADTKKKSKKDTAKSKPKAEEVPEAPEEADITENSMELDDVQTDKAVDDILAYESDVVLAVADSTAEEHNREVSASEPKKRHVFSTLFWTLITLVVILIIALTVLLVMGDSLADKLGL